jgi:hypothetical protein
MPQEVYALAVPCIEKALRTAAKQALLRAGEYFEKMNSHHEDADVARILVQLAEEEVK